MSIKDERYLNNMTCSHMESITINKYKRQYRSIFEAKVPQKRNSRGILAKLSQEEFETYVVKPMKLENPLTCKICDASYVSNIDFGCHSIKHNINGFYTCHMCEGYSHKNRTMFERHIRDHEGLRKFKCPVCGKQFQHLKVAYEHRFNHDNKKPFKCDICGKQFLSSYSLKNHKNINHYEILTGQKHDKFDCKLCNKHYKGFDGLAYHNFRNHKDLHNTIPILCEICGIDFPSEVKLKMHMYKHTGYKPFSCVVCSKSFTQVGSLNAHQAIHTGEKPFTCGYCGKKFPFRSTYSYHLKIHTGEKSHACLICEKKFISKGNLRLHLKNFHKLERK